VLGGSGGVRDDRDLETLLEELAQMALDAEVGRRASQDDLVDTALAQL